ncbi:hypothetical protein [Flavobacterium sp.]|uniref:hypothetical protein n=1 Tax=Flavobacterium sp. TaxID=239 RepID=UPI003C5D7501
MKTKILIASLLTSFFAMQIQAQYGSVNAMNNEISDNLDLKAVASIFGDSRNLQDFEERLNDPKIQISNLDLNYDNQVDYLRVIETVDGNTHLIIIQSVIDRDVYQDVATIDVERNNANNVQIHIVGNDFIYGPNYIYQPVYYSVPPIYASFYVSNYRPYRSTWYWNYYPRYYTAWRPYPLYRYRSNIHVSINVRNTYNYVNYRRNDRAISLYNSNRSNGYERLHPESSFSRRNASVNNRYELDQRKSSRSGSSRNQNNSSRNGNSRSTTPNSGLSNNSRNYSQKSGNTRENSTGKSSSTRDVNPQPSQGQRENSQSRSNSTREAMPQPSQSQRDNSQSRSSSTREAMPQPSQSQRENSQSRSSSTRQSTPQPSPSQRENSQSRSSSARQSSPQPSPSQNRSSESRSSSSRESSGRSSSSNNMSNRRT